MFVISVRDKPMKMANNVDGSSDAFCPKYGVLGDFKGGCPPVNGVSKGAMPLMPTQFRVSVTLPTQSGG